MQVTRLGNHIGADGRRCINREDATALAAAHRRCRRESGSEQGAAVKGIEPAAPRPRYSALATRVGW
jgi:hypothetical protein